MTKVGVILVLGLLGSLPPPSLPFSSPTDDDTYQVVFEEVGQVATSVTYIHLAIDLHIPDLLKAVGDYKNILDTLFPAVKPALIPKVADPTKEELTAQARASKFFLNHETWNSLLQNFTNDFQSLKNQFATRHRYLDQRIKHLTGILPHSATSSTTTYEADEVRFRRHSRTKRFIPLVILKGVVGTLMGLYNRKQVKKLRSSLDSVIKEQKRLLITDAHQSQDIANLRVSYNYLPDIVKHTSLMVPMKILVRLLEIEMMIDAELGRVTDAIQQAQH